MTVALTMTRTRTQTALTKLALMVANVHGELAFVEGLIAAHVLNGISPTGTDAVTGSSPDTGVLSLLSRLERRRQELANNRDALSATLRQFDPEIDPEKIGTSDEWQKRFGRGSLQKATLTARYKSQFHPVARV